jgi:predicted O-methyltransferase YrrM
VRGVIERLLREGTVVSRSDGSEHTLFPVAIGAAEGEALGAWVARERATQTIEIGLGYGISALFISGALLSTGEPSARHVVLDPNQAARFADCGLEVLEEAGLMNLIEFHADHSEVLLPRFLAERRTFDLAFVDGNHRFDGVFLDLVYLGRLLRPQGVVFVDDVQLPSVARATSFFVKNLGWTTEEISAPDEFHQWAVFRTPQTPDTRPFDHFVDF